MNHLEKYRQQLGNYVFLATFLPAFISIAVYIVCREVLGMDLIWSLVGAAALLIISVTLSVIGLFRASIKPLSMIWQAVWHVSPERSDTPPPNIDSLGAGRELVATLVRQIYSFVGNRPDSGPAPTAAVTSVDVNGLVESLPLPVLILDKNWVIKSVNSGTCSYLGLQREALQGKAINDVLRLSFQSDDTLDSWLSNVSGNKATATQSWEHVRLELGTGIKQMDLAASFSRDNSSGNEAVIMLFDRTETYSQKDKETAFVAMAVHELRTPLTMLRGYIEMFEDELGPSLSEEHRNFMRKMSAASQRLTAFVTNILNTSRIEENQFYVNLQEANWGEVLSEVVNTFELRAQVRGKKIQLNISEGLPTVGVDKLGISEVVGNLIENAIKYSGQSPDITISTRVDDSGMIETTVQDQGIGMPANVIGGLFTKYYRSHHSKNAVGGNGLGLYLVKSIVTAHGGNVWVQSKENEGSTFGFTLQPFSKLQEAGKIGQEGIVHQAGGWIKNHSLYRR